MTLSEAFKRQNEHGKKTNIVYLTPEYPFEEITVPLVKMLAENNVHVVEIGVPFSDPLADGPTIQYSSFKALQKNVNLKQILKLVAEIRRECDIPIVLMSYLNPLLSFGLSEFAKEAGKVGVSGLIVPDLPVDEADRVKRALQSGPDLVLLAAPTSTKQRLQQIASGSRGFIYCVSLTGVTGARDNNLVTADTQRFLKEIRSLSKLPIAVGFGISEARHIQALWDYSDGFIVGSAFIKALEKGSNRDEAIRYGMDFVNTLFGKQ